MQDYKIYSWNVNGLRSVIAKGAIQKLLDEKQPDILCLQEIKAKPEQIDHEFPGYKIIWRSAKRPGYSGVATLLRQKTFRIPDEVDVNEMLAPGAIEDFLADHIETPFSKTAEDEGRLLVLDFSTFALVNVYTPNSKTDLSRLEFREKIWDPSFLDCIQDLDSEKPLVICGDFNAAHTEIDLARPKANQNNAGFTKAERKGIDNILKSDFVDTFRTLHPSEQRYTWWSHWGKARENNVGWRIDYFLVSEDILEAVSKAEIHEEYTGSDHCPISITIRF